MQDDHDRTPAAREVGHPGFERVGGARRELAGGAREVLMTRDVDRQEERPRALHDAALAAR
jgi:hypothetical protein